MQIFSVVSNLTITHANIVVALGTFDGVHIGHQNIIKQAIGLAKSIHGTSVVFSFSNHPLSIVSPKRCPLRIADNVYKEKIMKELGVNVLMNIPFTSEFLKLTPLEFLTLLKKNLAPRYIVVGPNYSFGYGGKGNPDLLVQESEQFGFISKIHPAVCIDGKIASSTRIRRLIAKGDMQEVCRLLGNRFSIQSVVVRGDQRGRILGFPTANFFIEEGRSVPCNGVYAVYAIVRGQRYQAIANVGTNPTFNGKNRHIEIHILNFSADIYGKEVLAEFIQKIRDEQTFQGPQNLITQIHADIRSALDIFSLQR